MHFEILVEDQSGKITLDILVPKIIGHGQTFTVHSYKGIGRIPKHMRDAKEAKHRILMENLPKLLKGYGRTQAGRENFPEVVILVCDLDDKCLGKFLDALNGILHSCHPRPKAGFCIAIEEGEAWFLGDLPAVIKAYPKANKGILESYVNDSICGTWELLADAVYPGGKTSLASKGWQAIGAEKGEWANIISPHMDLANNKSPSFAYFCRKLREFSGNACVS